MRKYTLLLLLLLGCSLCFSQESLLKKYDNDLSAFKTYKAGEDNGVRSRLEAAFYTNELSGSAKQELRQKLVAVFRDATLDGQRTLYRILWPTINEASALPLIPLLTDSAVHPETAKTALMILQEAPGNKINTALNSALTRTKGDLQKGIKAAIAKRSTKKPESRSFFTSPYDPDRWPGEVAGKVQRVDLDQLVAKTQTVWLAESDPIKKKELARQFASKASLLTNPVPAFLNAIQKSDKLNDQKELIAAMGEKCHVPAVVDFAIRIMKENPSLRPSAGLALVRMANTIRRTDPVQAKSILTTVKDQVGHDDISKRAHSVLSTIDRDEGCIRDWLYAGPFTVQGKSGEEVFRQIVPAEADRPETQWQQLMVGWQSGNRWNLEVGIEPFTNATACLKTYIWSDIEQTLTLQTASTGGIAVWCDKKPLVNQWREGPFEQWTFSTPISLKKGYNTLIVKTGCTDKGWFFSARLRTVDHQTPKNIRVETRRKNPPKKVLLFTGSQTWVHSPTASGPHGNSCAELILKEVCRELGFELVWTDSGEIFNRPLDDYAAFIFYTCGELNEKGRNGCVPVNDEGMKAFLTAIREQGIGFFAIHSASDTWHKWPEYIKLVGAELVTHGMQQEAKVQLVDNALHQMEKLSGKDFRHYEEWYTFRNFNPDMRVLMMLDTTEMITEGMNRCYKQPSFPSTWIRAEGKGIVAFTSLGHSCEFWRTPVYRALLSDLLAIVTRKQTADLTPNFQSLMNKK